MTRQKCKAKNRAGEPCGNYPMKGLDYCWIHKVWRGERPFWQNPGFFVPVVITLGIFAFHLVTGPNKQSQQLMLNKQDEQLTKTEEMKDTVTSSVQKVIENQEKIKEEIKLIHASITDKKLTPQDLEKQAEKTFEIARNHNANFLLQEGYEEKGNILFWFKPMWDGINTKKFYLSDFVGRPDKDRISVFIDGNDLVYQAITSERKTEALKLDISKWKKGKPQLICVQWDTNRNWMKIRVVEKDLGSPLQTKEKTVANLHFDKLGPLTFIGIDFEGKYPAKLKKERAVPESYSISSQLKRGGWKEYKE